MRKRAMGCLLKSDKLKSADFGQNSVDLMPHVLKWAARNSNTHDIVRLLFQKRPKVFEAAPPDGSGKWSAIKWAAYEQLPRLLSLLVSNSPDKKDIDETLESALRSTLELKLKTPPTEGVLSKQLLQVLLLLLTATDRTPQTESAVTSALESVKEFIKNLKYSSISAGQKVQGISKPDTSTTSRQAKNKSEEKDRDRNKTSHEEQRTEAKKKAPSSPQLIYLETIRDILEDPPFAQIHKDRKGYKRPRPKEGLEDVLQTFGATIVRFYKGMDESGTVRRSRPVQEVIYDPGPKKIMEMAVDDLERIIGTDSELPGYTVNLKAEPRFTWVHLPSTNPIFLFNLR
ncbi:ankyrin unc44 [Colletotrichum tofieldiae]|nr:ankyrin unc44 [Colletotrichum tofieldiae]